MTDIKKSLQSRHNQRTSEQAQDIVMETMKGMGFKCVERIETGFAVIRTNGKITGAYPKRRVSGDIRAIGHNGQAIHCECKYRPGKGEEEPRLKWGDFEPHQIEHFDNVINASGAAFVAWVVCLYPARLFFLQWPVSGLKKGKSLRYSEAMKLQPEYFGIKSKN